MTAYNSEPTQTPFMWNVYLGIDWQNQNLNFLMTSIGVISHWTHLELGFDTQP